MRENIPTILWTWALLSPLLFRLIPGRDAAIACLLVGWAILPIGDYPASCFAADLGLGNGGSAHALAVPAWPIASKAPAIGLGCLAGLLLFDRRAWERIRFGRADLPMAAWCLVPIASAVANGGPLSAGLAQSRYLLLAWGVPYAMGRAYLDDPGSRRRFLLGLVAAGLAYLPACLLENAAGPMLYGRAFGPHPYQVEGAVRALGHRPLVLLEHGNQLGIWMANSAIAATWLWATGAVRRPWGIPGGPLAGALVAATLLCQSHASILYLAVALLPLLAGRVPIRAGGWRLAAAMTLTIGALTATLLAARRGFDLGALREDLRHLFRAIRKVSFTWRLARSADYLPVALERPILGSGRPDWGPGGRPFLNPVNLGIWLLSLGMYGLVGLAASATAWIAPAARAIVRPRSRPAGGPDGALVALLIVNFLDGLSNSVLILPLLAAAGGLLQPAEASAEGARPNH
jgi:hypothetical protein